MKLIRNVADCVKRRIGGFLQHHRFGMESVKYAHVLDCLSEGDKRGAVNAVRHYLVCDLKRANEIVGIIEDSL